MAELTEQQRAKRRQQARDVIETAIANAPGAETASPAVLADYALDALGDLAAEILADGTMLRSLTIKDGVVTLELDEATEILKVFVASMRGILDGYGAENYVETEMTAPSISMDLRHGPDPRDSYTVTIQRRTGTTPHQFRERAEARIAALLAECDAIEADYHGQHDEVAIGARAALIRIRARVQEPGHE